MKKFYCWVGRAGGNPGDDHWWFNTNHCIFAVLWVIAMTGMTSEFRQSPYGWSIEKTYY